MKPTKSTFFLGCLVGGMGAALVPVLLMQLQADTKLLPFQGRLTDAVGAAVPDGAKVVEFKMYDAPTGGSVKWSGEVHKLSVNGGLVNTMLGSKASLGSVDFGSPTYLQITVDANGDDQISAADPPLLPRQSVVSAVYAVEAGNARGLQWTAADGVAQGTANWSALFGPGRDPATATVDGARVTANTLPVNRLVLGSGLTSAHLADNSVTASELANNSVDSAAIIDREVKSLDIGIGEVKSDNLAPNSVTAAHIENETITSGQIAAGGIVPDRLQRDITILADVKGLNQEGGTNVRGWQRRTLNTNELQTLTGSSGTTLDVGGDRFSLQPGVYRITCFVPGFRVGRLQGVVRDVTGSPALPVVVVRGSSVFAGDSSQVGAVVTSYLDGIVTVTGGARTYEVWQWTEDVKTVNGLGVGADTGPSPRPEMNVFTRITIEKIR